MEELKQKIEAITPQKPSPLGIEGEEAKKLTPTTIEKFAKKMGMAKVSPTLTSSQKVIRTALISFAIMVCILWSDWFVANTVQNTWIGTWEGFVGMVKLTAILFTQVVLAKVRQYFEEIR